jgi:hypothetical protein
LARFFSSGSTGSGDVGGKADEADVADEASSESEIALPPDELEMKHLKKLETMKESPA